MKLLHNGARALGGLLLLSIPAWAEETQTWRYFAADAADNPHPGQACITNGAAWALAVNVVDADARTLRIACAGAAANAYLTDPAGAPTLDLRGTVFGADETEAYTITKIAPRALGGDATKGTADKGHRHRRRHARHAHRRLRGLVRGLPGQCRRHGH